MATAQWQVTLNEPPDSAVETCVRALKSARFKKIAPAAGSVSARKRVFGQWTRSPVFLQIVPQGDGSLVTITAEATAQSLTGVASSPADRMVKQIARALQVQAPAP